MNVYLLSNLLVVTSITLFCIYHYFTVKSIEMMVDILRMKMDRINKNLEIMYELKEKSEKNK